MKSGIVIIAELPPDVGERILAIQRRYDPRMANELPPHITITGSSGMGPIAMETPVATLVQLLEPVAAATAPFTVQFEAPLHFMQTTVVVLPIDPHGPIRALHERIKSSGLEYEEPRFTFTPHCTLSFYPELSRSRLRDLLAERIEEPVMIDRIAAYRTVTLTRTERIAELSLGGPRSQGDGLTVPLS